LKSGPPAEEIMLAKLVLAGLSTFFSVLAAGPHPQEFKPTRFTVEVRGHGPDVIFIPGLASSREVFEHEAHLLVGHYRVHLVEINGFAGSAAGPNATGPVLRPIEDELDQYIRQNHLHQPAVIGHSLGGLIGLMLVADHSADVSKLMIVDSLPFFAVLFDPNATPQSIDVEAKKMREEMLTEGQAQFVASESNVISHMVKSPAGRQLATKWALTSDRKVMAQAFYEDMTTDMRSKLPEIQTPITVLYPWDGSRPRADVDAFYKSAYDRTPHIKMVCIEDASHFIMLDQPQTFAHAVSVFLKE